MAPKLSRKGRDKVRIALAVYIIRSKGPDESVEDFITSLRRRLVLSGCGVEVGSGVGAAETIRVLREEVARLKLKPPARDAAPPPAPPHAPGTPELARPTASSSRTPSPQQPISPTGLLFGHVQYFGVLAKEVRALDQLLLESEGRNRASTLQTTLSTLAGLTSSADGQDVVVSSPGRRTMLVLCAEEIVAVVAALIRHLSRRSADDPSAQATPSTLVSLLDRTLSSTLAALGPSPESSTLVGSLSSIIFHALIESFLSPPASSPSPSPSPSPTSSPPSNPTPSTHTLLTRLLTSAHLSPPLLLSLLQTLTTLLSLPTTLPPSPTLSDLAGRMLAVSSLADLLITSGVLAYEVGDREVEQECERCVVKVFATRDVWGGRLGGEVWSKVEGVWRGWWGGEEWDNEEEVWEGGADDEGSTTEEEDDEFGKGRDEYKKEAMELGSSADAEGETDPEVEEMSM